MNRWISLGVGVLLGNPAEKLGDVVAVYHPRSISRIERNLLAASFAGSLVLFLLSWGTYSYAYTHYGPSAADAWSQPWTLFAWVLGLICILWGSWRIFSMERRVILFQNGLQVNHLVHQDISLRWDELDGIAIQTIETSVFQYFLHSHQEAWLFIRTGKMLHLNDRLNGLSDLLTRIKANLYPRLLPDLRVALRDGRFVFFGPVSIHRRDGIMLYSGRRKRLIPWVQVRLVNILDGYLVIELTHQAALRLPIRSIPNLELLLQLIREEI